MAAVLSRAVAIVGDVRSIIHPGMKNESWSMLRPLPRPIRADGRNPSCAGADLSAGPPRRAWRWSDFGSCLRRRLPLMIGTILTEGPSCRSGTARGDRAHLVRAGERRRRRQVRAHSASIRGVDKRSTARGRRPLSVASTISRTAKNFSSPDRTGPKRIEVSRAYRRFCPSAGSWSLSERREWGPRGRREAAAPAISARPRPSFPFGSGNGLPSYCPPARYLAVSRALSCSGIPDLFERMADVRATGWIPAVPIAARENHGFPSPAMLMRFAGRE